jgi:hypothetical protein
MKTSPAAMLKIVPPHHSPLPGNFKQKSSQEIVLYILQEIFVILYNEMPKNLLIVYKTAF